ncbi:DUF6551 family protein [Azorhizobium doebereinerae]|uniref:DUF6551 family protein n=1 Tax=Azorhizobium doebereinerae TaxID=281091 RepID=UPI0003FFE42E|nr:DUF6551 family protein [Azorhizobium doebereinerae]
MTQIRPISPLVFPDLTPSVAITAAPRFIWIAPEKLLVDDTYQRNLSERSMRLLRRIIGEWDWRRFKPPVVVEIDGAFHVLDGQHTALAAASHPDIAEIPVMVVEAADLLQRARAFIGHNRDRISVTPTQLFHAAVAAGDPDEQTIQQVCERAGARVLKVPPANGAYEVGDTMAISTLRSMCSRLGAMKARQVVQCLVEAKCAPISADLLKAASELLHGADYAGEVESSDLATAIRGMGPSADREAAQFAAAKGMPRWRALIVVLYRNTRRRHGSRSKA